MASSASSASSANYNKNSKFHVDDEWLAARKEDLSSHEVWRYMDSKSRAKVWKKYEARCRSIAVIGSASNSNPNGSGADSEESEYVEEILQPYVIKFLCNGDY